MLVVCMFLGKSPNPSFIVTLFQSRIILWPGWSAGAGSPWTFLALVPEVPHPGKPLAQRNLIMVSSFGT